MAYSVRRYYIDEFLSRQVAILPKGSRVIDIGGHKATRRGQFNLGVHDVSVIYVNLVADKGCDIRADAAALPVRSELFDVATCSELLEHVPDPCAVIREAGRVLHQGGLMLICAPFMYRLHGDPQDFGRYTDTWWQRSLSHAGFKDVMIERQGMFWSVIADFFKQYVYQSASRGVFGRIGEIMGRRLVAWLVAWAVRHDQTVGASFPFARSFTTGFGIRATKP
jgi:SAM-dependent methyltransferase